MLRKNLTEFHVFVFLLSAAIALAVLRGHLFQIGYASLLLQYRAVRTQRFSAV